MDELFHNYNNVIGDSIMSENVFHFLWNLYMVTKPSRQGGAATILFGENPGIVTQPNRQGGAATILFGENPGIVTVSWF
jgi:hypothetical protein